MRHSYRSVCFRFQTSRAGERQGLLAVAVRPQRLLSISDIAGLATSYTPGNYDAPQRLLSISDIAGADGAKPYIPASYCRVFERSPKLI